MNWAEIPSLASLRAFEAAARCQSLSGAARELNVTHAAIAQHVRNLEAEFAEALLTRQGRGVVPTAAGAQLAETLRGGFGQIAQGVGELRLRGTNRPINISVTPVFAQNWLMPRLGDFWAKHPEIEVTINPTSTLVDLKRDGFDMGIRFGEGNWPGLNASPLTKGDFWVVGHPDLIKGRTVTCLEDVIDLPMLMESHMLERRKMIELAGPGDNWPNTSLFQTNTLVMSATYSGLGMSVQPRALVERPIKDGSLVKICELHHEHLAYHIITLPRPQSDQMKTFIRWLHAIAKKDV